MKLKVTICAMTASAFLAAAGGSGAFGAGGPTDVCALLTPAQVSAVLGVTVEAGKEQGKLDCQWSEPGKSLGGKRALLHIYGSVGRLTPVDQFNTVKTPLPFKGIVKTPLGGVGDDAVYVTTGGFTSLTVKKGDSVFQIRVYGFPLEQIKAKEKALAEEALPKL
jgi:hypothetical protein